MFDGIGDLFSTVATVLAVGLFVAVLLVVLWLVHRRRHRRIGPDEALIVHGARSGKDREGLRVIVGGGTSVKPFIEEAETLPLHALQLDVELKGVLAGDQRTPINVRGTAAVKAPVRRAVRDGRRRHPGRGRPRGSRPRGGCRGGAAGARPGVGAGRTGT